MDNVRTALEVLLSGQNDYKTAEAYYEGDVPEVFANARLRRSLKIAGEDYRVNFARTIVDAVLNRMEINAVIGTTQDANAVINRVWEQNDMGLEADEIHRRALEYGDCYAIVWPDEDGELQISYNSPLTTAIIYDQENPRKKNFAAKMWRYKDDDGTKTTRLNLYFPDRIEKYRSTTEYVSEGTQFTRFDTVDNPFGEVPVFHFRTSRPYGRPEHKDAYPLQDAINKLVITHMYTVDYQGAPQRYALANAGQAPEVDDFEEGDTERENASALQSGPGELWYLQGINEVGQFEPADPDVFLKPVRDFVRSMASLTNTPLHYFERTGNVPSGEALRVAEAPLLKKVADRQQSFSAAWRDMFRFILRVEGVNADVQVKWAAVESLDSLDAWDVMLKKRNAGVPMRQVFLEAGYDDEIIDQMFEWIKDETSEMGSQYQRKPQVRVETQNDENNIGE